MQLGPIGVEGGREEIPPERLETGQAGLSGAAGGRGSAIGRAGTRGEQGQAGQARDEEVRERADPERVGDRPDADGAAQQPAGHEHGDHAELAFPGHAGPAEDRRAQPGIEDPVHDPDRLHSPCQVRLCLATPGGQRVHYRRGDRFLCLVHEKVSTPPAKSKFPGLSEESER